MTATGTVAPTLSRKPTNLTISRPNSSLSGGLGGASAAESAAVREEKARLERHRRERTEWLQYARRHELLPLDYGDGVSSGGAMAATATGRGLRLGTTAANYYVIIHRITGVRLPPQVEASISIHDLEYCVRISFFDEQTKTFFG